MSLSPAQLPALTADIAANTATAPGTAGQIKDLPHTGDNAFAVAAWYNQTAAGPFVVWRDLPMSAVLGLIAYANMTPLDAVPTDTALNVAVWQARSLACQGKQFNLQNLTIGRDTAPMKRANYRAALQDCLTAIPAGAAGVAVAANWVGVRDAAKSNATNAEKLFASWTGSTPAGSGAGTLASPADLGYEGSISDADVRACWGI